MIYDLKVCTSWAEPSLDSRPIKSGIEARRSPVGQLPYSAKFSRHLYFVDWPLKAISLHNVRGMTANWKPRLKSLHVYHRCRREGLETEVGLGKHLRLAFLSSFLASNEENSLHKR